MGLCVDDLGSGPGRRPIPAENATLMERAEYAIHCGNYDKAQVYATLHLADRVANVEAQLYLMRVQAEQRYVED